MNNQKITKDSRTLDLHKDIIIKDLQLKPEPIVFYGDKAVAYVRNNVPAYKNKSDKVIKKGANGYFHYENLPKKYNETGVVCIFNEKIGTLAHELRHAKQFQNNNRWMKPFLGMKFFYKLLYPFYPPELEAFNYAKKYLKSSELEDELSYYKKHIRKIKCKKVFKWAFSVAALFAIIFEVLMIIKY